MPATSLGFSLGQTSSVLATRVPKPGGVAESVSGKERVAFRDASVACTSCRACSYSASSLISRNITGTSVDSAGRI